MPSADSNFPLKPTISASDRGCSATEPRQIGIYVDSQPQSCQVGRPDRDHLARQDSCAFQPFRSFHLSIGVLYIRHLFQRGTQQQFCVNVPFFSKWAEQRLSIAIALQCGVRIAKTAVQGFPCTSPIFL